MGAGCCEVKKVRMMKVALALVLLHVAVVLCASPEYNCEFTDPTTKEEYDLSDMYRKPSDVYSVVSSKGDTFFINVCGGTSMGCSGSPGSCQRDRTNSFFSCGLASRGFFDKYPVTGIEGVQLVYPDGALCGSVARTTTLNIACDSGTKGTLLDVGENVSCRYVAEFKSKYACPVSSSSSGGGGFLWGWFIIGMTLGFFFLYLVIGAAVKWKVYGADPKSLDMIPNLEFWKDLPFLCWDGCRFFVRTVSMGRLCNEYGSV